jgi:hypothetical protein
MGGACSTNWGEEECIEDIGGEARRKETTGRPRCRWAGKIKMYLREREDGMVWIGLIWLWIGTSGGIL